MAWKTGLTDERTFHAMLYRLAKEKNLFFMEAIWSRCFPAYEELKNELASGTIGEVLYLEVNFGLNLTGVERLSSKELGGGTIFDLGVYVLQLALLVMGGEPETITAQGSLNKEGVDERADILLSYPGGKAAKLSTHSRVLMDNSARIYGTTGCIKIEQPFHAATTLVLPSGSKHFPLTFKTDRMNFSNSEGLIYEAMEVRRCLLQGLKESPRVRHKETLTIAKWQEEIRHQLGTQII